MAMSEHSLGESSTEGALEDLLRGTVTRGLSPSSSSNLMSAGSGGFEEMFAPVSNGQAGARRQSRVLAQALTIPSAPAVTLDVGTDEPPAPVPRARSAAVGRRKRLSPVRVPFSMTRACQFTTCARRRRSVHTDARARRHAPHPCAW